MNSFQIKNQKEKEHFLIFKKNEYSTGKINIKKKFPSKVKSEKKFGIRPLYFFYWGESILID